MPSTSLNDMSWIIDKLCEESDFKQKFFIHEITL